MMDIKKLKHIHFAGIVGVGMTALALCAQDLGIKVTGSDALEAFATDDILRKRGIVWKVGFSKNNLQPRPDLVITTGAHGGFNNPEVLVAKELGIPVMSHAEALANFAEGKETIAVCGVGGKTTTSAMIATILDRVGMHPSFAIGVGNIPSLGTPGRYDPRGNVFICEADEFAVSPGVDNRPRFSLLNPKVVVVTNIEHDHPDVYPTLLDTLKAFTSFVQKVPQNGLLVANSDSRNVQKILKRADVPTETFGERNGDWEIGHIHFGNQESSFALTHNDAPEDLKLAVPGRFNIMNAAAAFIVCSWFKVPAEKIREGLIAFLGTKRRFEKIAEINDILVFDDYAHHPTEIVATVEATRDWFSGRRIVAVFQPHTYTRTKALFSEFAKSFSGADKIGFMDIYAAAREKIDPDISSKKLTEEAVKHGVNATYTEGPEETINWLLKTSKPGDVVLILGAGDIFLIIKDFVSRLKEKYPAVAGQVDKFEEFKKQFPDVQENVSLASLTTLKIGGPVRLVLVPKDEETLIHAIKFSREQRIALLVIGSGSDLLVNDSGFSGVVIKNGISGIKVLGKKITTKGGSLLQELVDTANEYGLAGFEKMAGVPGTVAGAVYGNAGAYGQTINDHLSRVRVSDCEKEFWITKEECDFGYRDSMFKKKKNLVILEVEFEAEKGNSEELQRVSQETIALRLQKYKEGIKTPGSFFKNVVAENLSPEVLSKIPTDKIKYGKIPAGYLLEEVGAKGMRRGDVQIAPHHGNLFMNVGNATAADFFSLAREFKRKVQEKFGITLEPEVQLVGFEKSL